MNRILVTSVGICGAICLALSATKLWFALPAPTASLGTTAMITAAEPWSTSCYQLGSLVLLAVTASVWFFFGSAGRVLASLLALWLVALLMFPWTVMIADPQTAGRAAWLQMQHENLTWLGGDLANSQEYAARGWKTKVYVVDTPRRVSTLNPPGWQPWNFGLDRFPDLFEWLGYTNTFCQFVRRGWFLAVGGTCLLLGAACLTGGTLDTRLARHALLVFCGGCLIACCVAWTPPFAAGRALGEARRHTLGGRYQAALQALQNAEDELPVFAEDTYYVAQVGLIEHRLGRSTPAAKLYYANLLEREGRFDEATNHCEQLLAAPEIAASIRREASRGLLRSAVHALNAGDDEEATRQLEIVLTVEPCNVKANYMLQLAYLRGGRRESLQRLVQRLTATYEYFCFPNKKVVLAAGQQNLFYAAYQHGDLDEAWSHSVRMKRP